MDGATVRDMGRSSKIGEHDTTRAMSAAIQRSTCELCDPERGGQSRRAGVAATTKCATLSRSRW